jgi:hypothetical protein
MGSLRKSLAFAALTGAFLASSAYSQDMRDRLKLNIPQGLETEIGHFPRGAPGISSGSPIAFGANWHDAFVGVGYQSPVRYSDAADGGAAIGVGLGDSRETVGLELVVNPLSTFRSGVGNRVGFSAKLHKLLPDNWGIAAGVQDIIMNKNKDDGNPSIFGVVSKVIDLRGTAIGMFKALTLSGGVGNEGFRLEKDIRNNNSTVGVFGSAALRVHEQVSVIADWGGQDLTAAVSFVPFVDLPFVITPGVADLTGQAGVYGTTKTVRPRFVLSAGFAFRW